MRPSQADPPPERPDDGGLRSEERAPRSVLAAAVLALFLVGLVAAEVLVRLVFPFATPDTLRAYSLEYESSPFTRLQFARSGRLIEVDPDKAWGVADVDAPREQTFYVNELGFRGPSFDPRKPEGVTRIFVLGGSAVFDQNVYDEGPEGGNSWPDRAQEILRGRGFDVEVVNAGTPSHSTTDALGRLVSEIWLYEPDVVLLYNAWNDIKNFRATEITPEAPLSRLIRSFDGSADPYRNYRGHFDRLLSRSQIYMKLRFRYLASALAAGSEGFLPTGTPGTSFGPFGPRQYELNLRHFVDVVTNIGARPILSTQVSLARAAEDERVASEYQLLDAAGLRNAYAEVDRITRLVAREEDVALFDAAERLEDRSSYLSDHVHLSREGSQAMANLLADFLSGLLGSDGPRGR